MNKKEIEAVRRAQVRFLFATRPTEERTASAVLTFYEWLQKNYPELLLHENCDPYQSLTTDLTGLYTTAIQSFVESSIKRRPKPVTRCTVCGKARYSVSQVKKRCAERYKGRRCRGVNQNTIGNWFECPFCAARGREGSRSCYRCEGSGWLFARP